MQSIGRLDLKKLFSTINVSTSAYHKLIDSMVNIKDDGLEVSEGEGLVLRAKGPNHKLITLYDSLNQSGSAWSISLRAENREGLNFTDGEGNSRLFMQSGGKIGIGTTRPNFALDVNGMVAMKGRSGNYAMGSKGADGKWHVVMRMLDTCQAFEIMSHIRLEGQEDPFYLTYTTVLISGGRKGKIIRAKRAAIGRGWFWEKWMRKIRFRWAIDPDSSPEDVKYMLQVRSNKFYRDQRGGMGSVYFRVTKLWDRNYDAEAYADVQDEDTRVRQQPAYESSSRQGRQPRVGRPAGNEGQVSAPHRSESAAPASGAEPNRREERQGRTPRVTSGRKSRRVVYIKKNKDNDA